MSFYDASVLTRGLLMPGRDRRYVLYTLLGQHTVDGWLKPFGTLLVDAADRMQRDLEVHGHVAEIGVHHGRLFVQLCLLRRADECAVAIDVFEDQHLNPDGSGLGDRQRLEAHLRRWDPHHHDVRIVKQDSRLLDGPALMQLAGGALRLISVDGGHTAELTEHDLTTASDALAAGGLIVLDDFFNELFPAVSEGGQSFLRAHPHVVPVIAGGNKTLLCHREHAEAYRTRLRELFAGHRPGPWTLRESEFLGRPLMSLFPLDPIWEARFWRGYARGRVLAAIGR